MSIFSRLTDIVNSNLVHMLDKAEDPEKMIRLMIQEMEDTLVEVKSQAARIIADKKTLQRRIESIKTEAVNWQEKAELAIVKERDDLAKAALAEKTKKQQTVELFEKDFASLEENYSKLKSNIDQLEAKLKDAKNRKKTIVVRRKTAQSQMQIQKHLNHMDTDSAFTKFEQFEQNLDRIEGELEAFTSSKEQSLEKEFEDLEKASSIENQLNELKKT